MGDLCPHTGRARLGYDRARILLPTPVATSISSATPPPPTSASKVPLQLIMAKTRISSVASSCGLHLYIPNKQTSVSRWLTFYPSQDRNSLFVRLSEKAYG